MVRLLCTNAAWQITQEIFAFVASIVAIVTLLGAIVVYFKNRLKKEKFPLIEARFGKSTKHNSFDLIYERDVYLCFYNQTNRVFYISDCYVECDSLKIPLPIFDKNKKGKDNVYENRIHSSVMPHAPCVINGVMMSDKGFVVPSSATLLVRFTNGKSFRYELSKTRLIRQEDFE